MSEMNDLNSTVTLTSDSYQLDVHPPTKAILYMAGGTYFAIHLPHQPSRWQRWWQWKLLGFRYEPVKPCMGRARSDQPADVTRVTLQ